MADIYNANTGEPTIKNGAVLIKFLQGDTQSSGGFNTPEIATLSGQYDLYDKYPRYYTGDTDD